MITRGLWAGAAFAWLCVAGSSSAQVRADPAAAIGQPFRISASVTQFCSYQPPATMCVQFRPVFDEFLAETRDAQWAQHVERLILQFFLVNGQPWAETRSLECRRTLCALEYAVDVDNLDHDADGSEQLERLMEPVTGVMAPELPSAGGKGKIVSVLIWRKRP